MIKQDSLEYCLATKYGTSPGYLFMEIPKQ